MDLHKTETVVFDMETDAGPVTLTADITTASLAQRWAWEDYRQSARDAIMGPAPEEGKDPPELTPEQNRSLLFHLYSGASLAGSIRQLTYTNGTGKEEIVAIKPDVVEDLPDLFVMTATTKAWALNPQWRPPWILDDPDPKDEAETETIESG